MSPNETAQSLEISRLREELSTSQAELAELTRVFATRTAELTAQVAELTQLVAKGNERIAELLAIVQRKKRGRRRKAEDSEPPPPPDVDAKTRASFEDRPSAPAPPGPLLNHPRPKQRPTGRKRLPDSLPADELTVYPERCPCGCGEFDIVDEVIEEKLHIKAHQRRRITHRKTGRCKRCGKRSTGEALPSPFARSKATCEWLAWLIVQKFQLLTPLDRVQRYLGVQGLVLAKSYLVSQTARAADLLEAIDGYHWKQLLAGDWMGTDGTGFKVQIRGVGLHHGFFEVYQREDLVVFQYEPEKGGETQSAKLAAYAGTLVVDAESRYNATFSDHPAIIEANCHAHPRRKLKDAKATQPVLAVEGGRFVSAMFMHDADAKKLGLRGDELVRYRQTHIRPIALEFRAWIDAVLPTLVPSDLLAKVLRYYVNHWTGLMRFLEDPVPIDNSASERAFQPVAKMRLNSLFAGGTEGAYRAVILLGIAATCKRMGVDFEAYLTWVFVRRGTHRHKYNLAVSELTPAAYKRAVGVAA